MRLLSHPLFAPALLLAVFGYGLVLAAFLLLAPALGTPWVDTLLAYCFAFDTARRVYRLDTLILYLLQPPLFAGAVGLLYADELRRFLKRGSGRALVIAAPLAFAVLAGLVAATSEVSASGAAPRPDTLASPLRQGATAPEIALTDHRGAPFRLEEERGRVVALTFFYANCHAACPTLIARMKGLEARAAGDLVLAAVTLDPGRDGVADLAAYARRWSLSGDWRLLTGDAAAVAAVARAYGVRRERRPDGEIAHENLIQLIDRQGRLGFAYRGLGHPEEVLARDLRVLLAERR
jgi:cytochrome oxidase Cu insertion factor (SCO1/SenC/PrrC family)